MSWPSLWTTVDETTDGGSTWLPIVDPLDGINPSSTNFQSDGHASAYAEVVGSQVFFRIVLKGDPLTSQGLDNNVWIVRFARDVGGIWTYTAEVGINGKPTGFSEEVYASDAAGALYSKVYDVFTGSAHAFYGARVTPIAHLGTTYYYLDWQVPLSAITAVDNLITSTTPVRLYFVTSTDPNNDNKDHFRCLDACALSWDGLKTYQFNAGSLPVELHSFTAREIGKSVLLSWKTVMEKNNYGFEIERAEMGSSWRMIGFVPGQGTVNTPQSYQFTDTRAVGPVAKYRLKQIDRGGASTYSQPVELNRKGTKETSEIVSIYPDPAGPCASVQYTLPAPQSASIQLFDEQGRLVRVLVESAPHEAGVYQVPLVTTGLSSGRYFCLLTTAKGINVRDIRLLR